MIDGFKEFMKNEESTPRRGGDYFLKHASLISNILC
jgi:hypothetical protein